jgi:hypothetical protein
MLRRGPIAGSIVHPTTGAASRKVPIHNNGWDAADNVASSLLRNVPLVHVQHLDVVILPSEVLHGLHRFAAGVAACAKYLDLLSLCHVNSSFLDGCGSSLRRQWPTGAVMRDCNMAHIKVTLVLNSGSRIGATNAHQWQWHWPT